MKPSALAPYRISSVAAKRLKPLILGAFALAMGSVALTAEEEQVAVPLSGCEQGGSCVIVFGEVGDAFEYTLSEEAAARYARGVGASGERSALPAGLRFDADAKALRGVPQQAGFHEFVLLETERGVTRERVLLIDIQAPELAAGGSAYAAYLASGTR